MSAPPPMYSTVELRALSRLMDEACEQKLFKGVKCCVLGATSSESEIVTVLVHPGFEDGTRNVDLYVDKYVHPRPDPGVRLVCLDDLGVCLRSLPKSVRRKERWFWSIFVPYPERVTSIPEPTNQIYDSFKVGDGKNTVKGNIVVVKADNRGVVSDVVERDVGHIEWLVYQYLEGRADAGLMRSSSNPLLKAIERFSPVSWGW